VADRLVVELRLYLAAVLRHGWEPIDVYRVLKRKAGVDSANVVAGSLVAGVPGVAPGGSRRRWEIQIDELRDGATGIDPQVPGWPAAVAGAVVALGVLGHLPPLPNLESFTGHGAGPGDQATSGVLAKVRGLLAKAESTTFPDEAEACMAKAQQLITRHNLDQAMAEARHGATPNAVEARRCWLEDPYLPAKSLLLGVVANANRCRAVSSADLGFVTVVGHADDVQGTEVLFTSLLVQATRRMAAVSSSPGVGVPARTRRPSYRRSFLVAFASRIGQRLAEAAAQATDVAGDADQSLLPVLARRGEQVDEAVAHIFPGLVESRMSVTDRAGWAAGTAAADLADLAAGPTLPTGATSSTVSTRSTGRDG